MQSFDFMNSVYEGVLSQSIFNSYRGPQDTKKVEMILEDYRNILEKYPPEALEEQGRIPDEMIQRMGEAGFFGLSLSESYGGLGITLQDQLKVVEEVASLDMSGALVFLAHMFIGIKSIELFGTKAQKQKYLTQAASGSMVFSYALTEPKIGSDARHIETRAELSEDGSHYILNGVKTYITNANYAKGMTVFAQMDPSKPGFMGAFIVETSWEGVKIGSDMPKMGLKTSSTATVQLKNVHVPLENLIGKPGEGYDIAMKVLNYGRLALMAASSGMTKQSMKDMRERARSRIQFGVPIEEFPLIQEKIVRAGVHAFVMEAMNYFTAGLLENDPEHNPAIETSHCKLYGTTRAWETLYDALQVAGGSGFISTQPYGKRMRDFRVTTIFEGTTEIHSIYPSLFAIGGLGKAFKAQSGLKRWLFIAREFLSSFRKMDWPLDFDDTTRKRAVKLAKANARTIKRMLIYGLVVHGKKVGEEQFFLRRITTLSVYCFAILSVLSRISAEDREKIGAGGSTDFVAYLLEEAYEARRTCTRFSDTKKENLHRTILTQLQ